MNVLLIEPFVFINRTTQKTLLYNTLSGEAMVCGSSIISNLLESPNSNMYSYELTEDMLKNPEFNRFIDELKNKKMGKMISTSGSTKPVQFSPIINLQCEKSKSINSIVSKDSILMNIIDLRVYLNSYTQMIGFENSSKQFLSCKNTPKSELKFSSIKKFIDPIFSNNSSIKRISILGGNVFEWKELSYLSEYLIENGRMSDCKISIYVNFCDIKDEYCEIEFLQNINLVIIAFPNDDLGRLNLFIDKLKTKGIDISLCFVIQNTKDFERIEYGFQNKYDLLLSFFPYFNKTNDNFFKENIFIDLPDLFQSNMPMEEISKKNKINPSNFGQLVINNDGDVYDNLNFPPIGNIYNDNIFQIIHKEIDGQLRWFDLRRNAIPCSSCLYSFLCPPISNYEYVLNKYNLCNVFS